MTLKLTLRWRIKLDVADVEPLQLSWNPLILSHSKHNATTLLFLFRTILKYLANSKFSSIDCFDAFSCSISDSDQCSFVLSFSDDFVFRVCDFFLGGRKSIESNVEFKSAEFNESSDGSRSSFILELTTRIIIIIFSRRIWQSYTINYFSGLFHYKIKSDVLIDYRQKQNWIISS